MDWQYYKAKWQEAADDNGGVRCLVCPRRCVIPMGNAGVCGVRRNGGGTLFSASYGYPAVLRVAKIESVQLKHYLPGTRMFGVGGFGCNLSCESCANANFAQGHFNPRASYPYYPPAALTELAKRHKCESLVFACSEPSVWAEYVTESAEEARKAGLGTAMVTNGFLEEAAAREILPYFEAVSVVFNGFQQDSYQRSGASLPSVCRTCEIAHHECKIHLELTFRIVPENSSPGSAPGAFFEWAMTQFGPEIPLHFMMSRPPAAEQRESPKQLRDEAQKRGFSRVYADLI